MTDEEIDGLIDRIYDHHSYKRYTKLILAHIAALESDFDKSLVNQMFNYLALREDFVIKQLAHEIERKCST